MLNKQQFIQSNSLDGGFLQSDDWRNFQKSTGKRTFNVSSDCFWANLIEHKLPLVGSYLYCPRGPVFGVNDECRVDLGSGVLDVIEIAKKENVAWIRVDVEGQKELDFLKKIEGLRIKKAPHDVQPRQIFVIDISKDQEDIMADMKSKTRYNIRLAKKKGVEIESVCRDDEKMSEYLREFLRLTEVMAKRSGIKTHSREYYEKMIENISSEKMRLYVAKFEDKVIAVALISFFGRTATYLHGGSGENRNVMAPFLLHWQIILDAKERGCERYDLGGVKTFVDENGKVQVEKSSWEGVTRFKLGFSETQKPLNFSGSYDIVTKIHKYAFYGFFRKVKKFFSFLK